MESGCTVLQSSQGFENAPSYHRSRQQAGCKKRVAALCCCAAADKHQFQRMRCQRQAADTLIPHNPLRLLCTPAQCATACTAAAGAAACLCCVLLDSLSPAPIPCGELIAGDAEVQEHHQLKPCLLECLDQRPDPALLVVKVVQQTPLVGPQKGAQGACCIKHNDPGFPTAMLQWQVHVLEQVLLLAVGAAGVGAQRGGGAPAAAPHHNSEIIRDSLAIAQRVCGLE